MGRWADYDTDAERLPSGMTRIGYDADTQQYTYRDRGGHIWEGPPGCQWGVLSRVPRYERQLEIEDVYEQPVAVSSRSTCISGRVLRQL